MFEIFALVIYNLQWLGIVLGVGAEMVLLVAHLGALYQHKPQWLDSIPAVRTAQYIGLWLIAVSGLGAIAFHIVAGQLLLLLVPVFLFKWALIVAVWAAFLTERYRGHALIDGFAGATWLALFLVHSLAPLWGWVSLGLFYAAWAILFGALWGAVVMLLRYSSRTVAATARVPAPVKVAAAPKPIERPPMPAVKAVPKVAPVVPPAPKPVVVAVAPPPVAKPVVLTPAPAPIPAAIPVAVATTAKKESWWHKYMALFAKKPHNTVSVPALPVAAAVPEAISVRPSMAAASAPVHFEPAQTPLKPAPAPAVAAKPAVVASAPAPSGARLPVVEHLELAAPHAPVPAPVVTQPRYAPDYIHAPGLRVMPQRPEDLHKESRGPIVQPA